MIGLVILLGIIAISLAFIFAILYLSSINERTALKNENLRLKQILHEKQEASKVVVQKPVQVPKELVEVKVAEKAVVENKVEEKTVVENKIVPKVVAAPVTVTANTTVNAPLNNYNKSSLNWIHIGLIIGMIFVFISSVIFATTTWSYLPNFVKVIIITMSVVTVYFGSFVFEKLKLYSTSKAFHFIGLSLLFINVIALAFFELLPYSNCFAYLNKFLTFSIATFVVGIGLIFSVIKYKMEVLKLLCATSFFISFMLLINYFLVYYIIQVFIILILNIMITLVNVENKTFKSFKVLALYFGLIFIFTNHSLHTIWYVLVYMYGLLFFVNQEKKYETFYVCSAAFITLLASFNISMFFGNFELSMIVINLCSCLVILSFSYLKIINKKYLVPLILTYTCISFIMFIMTSLSNIFIVLLTLLNIFGIYLIIRKSTNKVLQVVPICLLMIWLLKFFELYYSTDSFISSYVVYIIFTALYIINIFVKKLYRNSFVDLAFMLLITFAAISEIVFFSANFLCLFYISQYLISNIVIFKEDKSYASCVVSVISAIIFTMLFAWSMSDLFVSLTMLLIFLVFTGVIVYAIRAYNKNQTLVLKVYQEVATFTFMYFILYSCIIAYFIGSIKIFDLLFGLTILILTFMLITSKKLYARYVMPYVIIAFGTITFTAVIEYILTQNIVFWTYAINLIVFMTVLLFTTVFHNNKYLQLFKLPIFLSASLYTFLLYSQVKDMFSFFDNFNLTDINELIYFIFTLLAIFIMYVFTCKQKALLGTFVPVTSKIMSLVAGVWAITWYDLHFVLIYHMLEEDMKNLYALFAFAFVIIVSTIINRLYKKNDFINMFHVVSIMLLFMISVDDFYMFTLYALYIISLKDIVKNNIYSLTIKILATISLALAFISQQFVYIPSQIMLEYICLITSILFTLIYVYLKNYSKYIIYIYEMFIVTLSLVLLSNALIIDELLNVSIILIVSTLILIASIIKKNYSWFIPYIIIVTIIVLYFTLDFWTSISWWIYLFVAGVTLITIAVINEFKLKRSSKTFSSVIKGKLKAWKW